MSDLESLIFLTGLVVGAGAVSVLWWWCDRPLRQNPPRGPVSGAPRGNRMEGSEEEIAERIGRGLW